MKFCEIHINLDIYNMTWRTQEIAFLSGVKNPFSYRIETYWYHFSICACAKSYLRFSGRKTNDIQFQVRFFFPVCCLTNSIKYKQVISLRLFNQNTTQKNKFVACHRLFTSIMINFINLLTS